MPDISSDKATATAYPPQTLYDSWCTHADELEMTKSQFIIRMVESGRKSIEIEDVANDSLRELREQRADLQDELERQRSRVKKLERQLHHTAHADIVTYVNNQPGVDTAQIIQHVADSVPSRVASHLDLLEGDEIERLDTGYYPIEDSGGAQRERTVKRLSRGRSQEGFDEAKNN